MIIETCPKCGHDLQDEVICTYPPIPLGGNTNNFTDKNNISIVLDESSTNWNSIDITDWDSTNIKTSSTINTAFCKNPCENCPNNPKNGGDGVCFCILGQQNIVY